MMLFRIEDSNGFDPVLRKYDLEGYEYPELDVLEIDEYIANQIRKEVNGSKKRNLLSYSKSLATCILKYDPYADNELHILNDAGFINSILYQTKEGIHHYEGYYLHEKVFKAVNSVDNEAYITDAKNRIILKNFILDISDNNLVDLYLRLYTSKGKKKLASPEKDSEVVVMLPMNDVVVEQYLPAIYILYALQYKYGFITNDGAFHELIEKLRQLPDCRFEGCFYDERSALISLICYLKYNWNYEKSISKKIYDDFLKSEHLSLYYDSILEFNAIVRDSFKDAYHNSDYNDNVISDLCWSICYHYLMGEYNNVW